MEREQIMRTAVLSLRGRKIARKMCKKHGIATADAMVRSRVLSANYDETYLLWIFVSDCIVSIRNGSMIAIG